MIKLMEHNIPTYKKLCEMLEKHNRVALVQATGTGKSYIACKYIEEHNLKTAIIVPSLSIGEQWSKLTNADIYTYQTVSRRNSSLDWLGGKGYQLIICDEMHHLGAEEWGKFFHNLSGKILGLTATEIRYLDGSRNIVTEFFEGNGVYGVNLAESINQGILPTFKYISVLYQPDFEKYKELIKQGSTESKKSKATHRLEHCMENYVSIEQALSENLSKKHHHIVCFFNNIDELRTQKDNISHMFPNYESFEVHSKKTMNNATIKAFKDSKQAIIFCVNMLNEGVHIDGVDVVIFLRTTESPILYFQQLGRCLDSKGGEDRVVFDFVCNSERIHGRMQSSQIENRNSDFVEKINKDIITKKRIIYKNYTKDLSELWDEINSNVFAGRTSTYFKTKEWSASDDLELIEKFDCINDVILTSEKLNNVSKIAKEMGYRYSASVRQRIVELQKQTLILSFIDNRIEEEEWNNYLRENLPPKTYKALISDYQLGFTESEIDYIKDNANGNLYLISEHLCRNLYSVFMFCKRNGIYVHYSPRQEIGQYLSGKLVKVFKNIKELEQDGFEYRMVERVLFGNWSSYLGFQWDFPYRQPGTQSFPIPDNGEKIVVTYFDCGEKKVAVFNSFMDAYKNLAKGTTKRGEILKMMAKVLSGELSQIYIRNYLVNIESIQYLGDREKSLEQEKVKLLKQLEEIERCQESIH